MLNCFARSGRKIEKIDSLCPGRGQARLARAGEGSIHTIADLHFNRSLGSLRARPQARLSSP